ncbi:ubiquinone/menaquinone biosynthesis C-methylase UbiE [Methanohalophilus levihalophilus]|uniref:methyltransferase domain-containing protein n=1 Tax=Methanohalophilus levihalophilus TaxID=1431282 RepID=UPI001AEB7FBF|nr:methyltransferase domain-containing protein [Methanohalophilus levihalophilus]MBP2029832.1 ubiquinone/menaquinone biosynthesis C-methylase UbiE [Methanohalophilus levihalophilus]
MPSNDYVHGYSERESIRLCDQANTLEELLHSDTMYPSGSKVLEAGCGIGAQTAILARNSPEAHITSVDISEDSLNSAKERILKEGITNVDFFVENLFDLPFEDESFDHVFVCFVLEHLKEPVKALESLRRVLKKGGTITVIEGDHGSCFFHPETENALKAWNSLIEVQAKIQGDSLIGRQVYPLLKKAGFNDITVSPRMVYSDSSRPHMEEGFVRKTIIPMVEGVRENAVEMGLIDSEAFDSGIEDLHKTAADYGTFMYTFFKGVGKK